MSIEETLSIVSNFTELSLFQINEEGKIKRRVLNSKEDFNAIGINNIYEFFPKEDTKRLEEMIGMEIEEERENFKLKNTFGISDYVTIGIKRIDGDLYVCFKFVKSEREKKIQYERRLSQLEMAASTDSMTKLLNRYGYWERVKQELNTDDMDRKLGILMVDVDNLKGINTELGHKGGDKALKQISELISTSIRSRDIAVRYGGDEFVIVVVELSGSKSTAYGLGKRLVRTINENRRQFLTTVSIGVHVVRVGDFEEYLLHEKKLREKWDKAVIIADKMAYEAKESGRNKVVFSGEN
jgi:diguanylate cyclase (GGDEF)-like protein